MNSIATKIIETRKTKGLTQEELAERAKVNLRTIQRIESSESEPRDKTLKVICEVLDIETEDLIISSVSNTKIGTMNRIINWIFLIPCNMILMGIAGYMTLHVEANLNSMVGGLILSFLAPFFLVVMTKKMDGLERMFKFGSGYIIYFLIVVSSLGFPKGFVSGLFPCFLISLAVLYYGSSLVPKE